MDIAFAPFGLETASVQRTGHGIDRRQMLRQGMPGIADIAAGCNRVLIRANQLFPFRYLSNQSSVRRIASIWFSRFSKPWPSLAVNNVASDYGQVTTKTEYRRIQLGLKYTF